MGSRSGESVGSLIRRSEARRAKDAAGNIPRHSQLCEPSFFAKVRNRGLFPGVTGACDGDILRFQSTTADTSSSLGTTAIQSRSADPFEVVLRHILIVDAARDRGRSRVPSEVVIIPHRVCGRRRPHAGCRRDDYLTSSNRGGKSSGSRLLQRMRMCRGSADFE